MVYLIRASSSLHRYGFKPLAKIVGQSILAQEGTRFEVQLFIILYNNIQFQPSIGKCKHEEKLE